MKAKQVLFYAVATPIGIISVLMSFVTAAMAAMLAIGEVWNCLMSRWEHVAFDCPKDYFINTPWRKTLKQVFVDSYNGILSGSIAS